MDAFEAGSLEAFRAETRDWLAANYPPELQGRGASMEDEAVWGGRKYADSRDPLTRWRRKVASRGWTAPTWPAEYGGGGLTPAQARVLAEEMARGGYATPLVSFGIWMLGPVLLEYATEAQKQAYLPDIVRGDIRWCQGYSEPGAGSDLAGLQTRCEDRGDHYLINGQKVWTSYADQADWIFALVRTDKTKKHEGISFILIDMASPGVETRPIKLISGNSPFCETFFTDVKVPKGNLVGKLNGGWEIAKRLLQYERQNISVDMGGGRTAAPLGGIAKKYIGEDAQGRLADGDLRARIAQNGMAMQAFMQTVKRVELESRASRGPSAATSIMKYAIASIAQERAELLVEALGYQGLGWEGDGYSRDELLAVRGWLRTKGNSIEGGTSEVNLNVVAKRVLGLLDHQ